MLRWLFLIFLLLNLLLFLWGYQRPIPGPETVTPLPEDVPGILLLGETEKSRSGDSADSGAAGLHSETTPKALENSKTPDAQAQDETPDTEDGGEDRPICIRLGPFDQKDDTFDMLNTLNQAGHDAELDINRVQNQSGFWVLIPAGSEDPDFVIANLELVGVEDVWRFSKGELAGAISLGLYSDRQRAERRVAELRDKGFDAEIQARELEQLSFWINTRYRESEPDAVQALEQLFNANPGLSYPAPECGTRNAVTGSDG